MGVVDDMMDMEGVCKRKRERERDEGRKDFGVIGEKLESQLEKLRMKKDIYGQ